MNELLFDTIQIPRNFAMTADPASRVARAQYALDGALCMGSTEDVEAQVESVSRAYSVAMESLLEGW